MLKLLATSSMQGSQIFVPSPVTGSIYRAATEMVDRFEAYCSMQIKYKEARRLRRIYYWLAMRAYRMMMELPKQPRQCLERCECLYVFHRSQDVSKPAQLAKIVLKNGVPTSRIDLIELNLDNDIWLSLSHDDRLRPVGERTVARRLEDILKSVSSEMSDQLSDSDSIAEATELRIKKLYDQCLDTATESLNV